MFFLYFFLCIWNLEVDFFDNILDLVSTFEVFIGNYIDLGSNFAKMKYIGV